MPNLVPVVALKTISWSVSVSAPPVTVNPPVAEATVMLAVPSKDTPPIVLAVVSFGDLTTAKSAVVVPFVTVTLPSAEATLVTVPVPATAIHFSPVDWVLSADNTCPSEPAANLSLRVENTKMSPFVVRGIS